MDDGRITDITAIFHGGERHADAEGRRDAPESSSCEPSASRPQHCPLCDGDLVYPVDWRHVDASSWALELRCPDCGTVRAVSLDREATHRYNVLLYRSTERLVRQAEELTRECAANDERRCRTFVTALRGDLILPMDF